MAEDSLPKKWLIANRYEVQGHLGSGGFSQVFLAYDREMNRSVALKRISLPAGGEGFEKQRDRELRIHGQLPASHIVAMYDCFIFEGSCYFVLELMDRSLAKYVEPVDWKIVAGWLRGCLEALQAIHFKDILHRDIKPSNIFVDSSGSIRLGDFGVAQSGESISLPALSPQYVAPEMIEKRSGRKVGPNSDLYSLIFP